MGHPERAFLFKRHSEELLPAVCKHHGALEPVQAWKRFTRPLLQPGTLERGDRRVRPCPSTGPEARGTSAHSPTFGNASPWAPVQGTQHPVPAVSLSPECPRVRQAGWVTLPPGPARPGPGSQSRTEQRTGQRGGTRPRAAGAWCLCPEVMLAPTASRAGAWRHQGRRALWDGVWGTVIGPGPCCRGTAHRDRQWHTWGPGGRAAPAKRATCGQDN